MPELAQPNIAEFSIRLLKRACDVAGALRADHELTLAASDEGILFLGQSPARPPAWTRFLSDIAPEAPARLRAQSCSAVLFVEAGPRRSKRLFAVCFGQGHHSLNPDAIERRFGLKVVLNSVARGRLRTLDSASLDSTVIQRRVQASRDSDLIDFGLNADRDLLRLASGTPTSKDFANVLSGKDALHVRARVRARQLSTWCAKALELFNAKDYQKDFGFIDYITPVDDSQLVRRLDEIVFKELQARVTGTPSDLHLAIPDILSPESPVEIGYYGHGLLPGGKTAYFELSIDDYVEELRKGDFASIADMTVIRTTHEIRVITDGEGDRTHKRRIYSCFVFESDEQGSRYVLFDGEWYLIAGNFVAEVERDYQALLTTSSWPTTTAKTEVELIAELAGKADLLCMDRTRSAPQGAPTAAIEACDFLGTGRRLIHLKDGHGSAPLSHLWNQALVSAEALAGDQQFRTAFRRAVRKRERKYSKTGFAALVPTGASRLVAGNFPIILGVMRHKYAKSSTLGLPFFSKVALRAAADRLSLIGYPIELHLIEKLHATHDKSTVLS